jgi:hypothetical protein
MPLIGFSLAGATEAMIRHARGGVLRRGVENRGDGHGNQGLSLTSALGKTLTRSAEAVIFWSKMLRNIIVRSFSSEPEELAV